MISGAAVMIGIACLLMSAVICTLLTPIARAWALRRGFIDRPSGTGGHKTHTRPTAFGGGTPITIAIVLPIGVALILAALLHQTSIGQTGWLASRAPDLSSWFGGVVTKIPQALGILAGAVVLHVLGLIDDRQPLSAGVKLLVQVIVALILTVGLGIRSAEALGTLPSIVLSTIWIVALTNAFNFLDNMDGLSAGVAFLAAVVLAISAFLAGQVFVPCLLLLVAGACLGFLVFNFPPASIFMGDAGSLVIGYMLAVCAVLTTFYNAERGTTPFGVLVPLVVFAIPLYDFLSVIIHRLRQGKSIFKSDRGHFSHRLVRRGMTPTIAVLTIYLATVATALPAILLPLHGWPVAILIVAQCLAVVVIIAMLESADGS